MNDLNFFSPYTEAKRPKSQLLSYILLSIPIVIVIMSSYYYWSELQISKYQKQIDVSKRIIDDKDTKLKLNELNELKRKADILNKYYQEVEKVNKQVIGGNIVQNELIKSLKGVLPNDSFYKSITINESGIQILGVSKTRTSIAETEYNLKQLSSFRSVHVSNIKTESEDSGNYLFTIKCTY